MSSMTTIPAREKLAYGMGDFASMLIFQTVGTFLMFFYTDIGGLPAAAVGTLLLVARVSDALWDILLGALIDRTKTRWGQCRPYLLFGAPLVALCAIATFSVPAGDGASQLTYAYVTYILLMVAYSLVNIPYGAMPALMTDDPRDRTKLASGSLQTQVAPAVTLAIVIAACTEAATTFRAQHADISRLRRPVPEAGVSDSIGRFAGRASNAGPVSVSALRENAYVRNFSFDSEKEP